MQIPLGPKDFKCPLLNKPMVKVCHTCPWWVYLRQKNKNTGEEIDNWNCAIPHLVVMSIENAQMGREAGAAVESFRNEVIARSVAPREPKEININNTKQLT